MKRFTVSVVAEKEEDLLSMIQMAIIQFAYLKKTHADLVTHSGYIRWKLEDSKDRNMINLTLIEEKE